MKRVRRMLLCGALAALLLAAGAGVAMQPIYAKAAHGDVLLVNVHNPLPESFSANDLVLLYGEKRCFGLATSDIRLVREAYEAAYQMFLQAKQEGVERFTITSGYRSEEKQRELYENDYKGVAAMPGASEHQSGLAFDVTTRYDHGSFEDTEQFKWLSENCWEYGFILRYPKGKESITGFPYEPWHYRYVGVEIAREIQKNGWTLEEYCEKRDSFLW